MINWLNQNYLNAIGWSNNSRKIVVIESDDWGSIRMPNRKVQDNLFNSIPSIEHNPYCKFDTLASNEDLDELFSVLSSFKDRNNRHPVITANTVVANPNFDKIRSNGYQEYYYQPFAETLKSYYPNENVFKTWIEGINDEVFYPQFHGREHVNVEHWLKSLRVNSLMKKAFEFNCWGLPKSVYFREVGLNLQATYDAKSLTEISMHKESLSSGLKLFNDVFGFSSESFIPNNFIFDKSRLIDVLYDNGVRYLQGMKYHKNPCYAKSDNPLVRRRLGNDSKFVELVRNVTFEPSQETSNARVVEKALSEISTAFFWGKPAIITSHRLNFIGGLNVKNRRVNLKLLKELIGRVLHKWPDVEFMNSVQLAEYIVNN